MRLLLLASLSAWLLGPWMLAARNADEMNRDGKDESSPSLGTDAVESVPFRLMNNQRETRFRGLLPSVADEDVQNLLNDPRTLLYTSREIPKAYQQWDGALPGVHAVSYNISADQNEPFGNGNLEFPWRGPAGTHRTSGVESFKFLSLPSDENGEQRPVAWYRRRFAGDNQDGYAWIFPSGAIVGECLLMKSPEGELIPFELRIRRRTRDDWEVDVFRPFPTSQDLATRIQQLRPEWEQDEELRNLVEHLQSNDRLSEDRLVDGHPSPSFIQTMGVDRLPAISDSKLVEQLLTETPFKSAHGAHWAEDNEELFTAAPTTDADFHIVPRNYSGGFVEVDETSCIRCHETVGKHVRNFEYGRDWYGRVRGSDGIFSFHPFSRGSISYNGMGNPVSMNAKLIDAGYVERFDPETHPNTHYKRLSFIGE